MRRRTLLLALGVLALVVVAVILGLAVRDNPALAQGIARFGYPGVFIAALVSGFNLVIPIPVATFIPAFIAAGLAPALVVLTIALGTTIADCASYFIGDAARREQHQKIFSRTPMLGLYVFAAVVPLPNEVVIVPLAALGYPLRRIIVPVFLGNLTFNALVTLGVFTVL